MEFLTKPVKVDTGKVTINLRLFLNDRQSNLLIMVTNGEDTQRRGLKAYPYHYTNFDKEESKIKEYITESLTQDLIKHSPQDVTQLVNYLKNDMKNNIEGYINFPQDNKEFLSIYDTCQNENRTNSELNISDIKEYGKATTPQAITREILINKYQDVIDKINNGETKELVLDCKDFDININKKTEGQFILTDMLEHSPQKFIDTVQNELTKLIFEKPPSNNPYEIEEDTDLYYLRFKNLKESTPLKYMLSGQVGRFTQTQGVVQGVYPIRPRLKTGVFECLGCMRRFEVEQTYKHLIQEPSMCTECGGRNFRLLNNESIYTNERVLLITEPQEDLNLEDHPRQLKAELIGNKDFVTQVNAGTRVNLTGVLYSLQDKNSETMEFNYIINNIDKLEDKTITLTPEDKTKYLGLSKREDLLDLLVNSFAPELILPRELKESILLYLVKSGEDLKGLDMIHILIISDPATAKSSLKEKVKELTEKGVLASGTGSSAVGLTGAVVKDPITNNWVLTAGAIPLANNGHCIIDEIDKMSKEDTTHANNFMESGYDNFNKAGVNGTLIGKTSILALGNPKFGRYDRYKSLQDQVDIARSFQSRFDLIFLIEDKPNTNKDNKIIDSILNGYDVQDNKENPTDSNSNVQEVKLLVTEELKKYLAFARNNFNPKLTPEARKCIKEYGQKVRSISNEDGDNNTPYHWRFIRAIPKLAGAYAKLHLRESITKEDVQNAIALKEYSIKLIGLDPVTNTIDPDRVTGNNNQDDKRQREIIKHIIKEYVQDPNNLDNEGIPPKVLLENYQRETNKSQETFYRRLKELKEAGEVLESGRGRGKQYKLKNTV